MDSARRLLDSNSSQLQQLCERSGFTAPDDQGVHEAYGAAVKEWEGQMLQRFAGVWAETIGRALKLEHMSRRAGVNGAVCCDVVSRLARAAATRSCHHL